MINNAYFSTVRVFLHEFKNLFCVIFKRLAVREGVVKGTHHLYVNSSKSFCRKWFDLVDDNLSNDKLDINLFKGFCDGNNDIIEGFGLLKDNLS